jgi:hypothetical protein
MAEDGLKRISLQGNYLGQIVLRGSGFVKLPDVFTVWRQPVAERDYQGLDQMVIEQLLGK